MNSSYTKQLPSLQHSEHTDKKLSSEFYSDEFGNICNKHVVLKLGQESLGYLQCSSEGPFQWICFETRNDNSKHWHWWPIFCDQPIITNQVQPEISVFFLIFYLLLFRHDFKCKISPRCSSSGCECNNHCSIDVDSSSYLWKETNHHSPVVW